MDVSKHDAEVLAKMADLPIKEDRYDKIIPQLKAWTEAANELNKKMSAPKYINITPVTTFTQPHNYTQDDE